MTTLEKILRSNLPCLPLSSLDSNVAEIMSDESKIEALRKEFLRNQKQYEPLKKGFIETYSKKQNFPTFVNEVSESWKIYLRLACHMDALHKGLSNLYPAKLRLIGDLVNTTSDLNALLWFITDLEKEVYETVSQEMDPERLSSLLGSVRSLPTYLGMNFGQKLKGKPLTEDVLRDLIEHDEKARVLFESCGYSIPLLGNLLKDLGIPKNCREVQEFVPINDLEAAMRDILNLDHFTELFLRKSGLLMVDAAFYTDLSKTLDCRCEVADIKKAIADRLGKYEEGFSFNIPRYVQSDLSCGAVSLMNVLGSFIGLKLDRTLEKKILGKVTAPGFMNNLPSSLARVALEDYHLGSRFLVDLDNFRRRFIDNPSMKTFPPLLKFLEDYPRIPVSDVKGLNGADVVEGIKNGRMIAYVGDSGDYLYYRLIYGFKKVKNGFQLHVFDPLGGEISIPSSELYDGARNKEGFWAVEFSSPEIEIFNLVNSELNKAKEKLKWKEQIFSISKM